MGDWEEAENEFFQESFFHDVSCASPPPNDGGGGGAGSSCVSSLEKNTTSRQSQLLNSHNKKHKRYPGGVRSLSKYNSGARSRMRAEVQGLQEDDSDSEEVKTTAPFCGMSLIVLFDYHTATVKICFNIKELFVTLMNTIPN